MIKKCMFVPFSDGHLLLNAIRYLAFPDLGEKLYGDR
jgi:hypothetical protein